MSTAAPSPSPAPPPRQKPPNALTEIGITILVPALMLMQLSDRIGALPTLLLALAFPLGWGLWMMWTRRKFGLMATIGVISTAATGGIGVLHLDAQWLAVKEAAVPSLFGIAVAVSAFTKNPLIHALVFNPSVFDVEKINAALAQHSSTEVFDKRLRQATWLLAGTFAFSAVANYFLARWIVNSPAGSPEFNAELGRLTLLSYPIIALPSMAMMMGLVWWLARECKALTGLGLTDMMRTDG